MLCISAEHFLKLLNSWAELQAELSNAMEPPWTQPACFCNSSVISCCNFQDHVQLLGCRLFQALQAGPAPKADEQQQSAITLKHHLCAHETCIRTSSEPQICILCTSSVVAQEANALFSNFGASGFKVDLSACKGTCSAELRRLNVPT